MIRKTLRIKKIWFDAIAEGSKKIEYRADKPFYEWLGIIKPPFEIMLHYQKPPRLIKTAYKIKLIRRPNWIDPLLVPTRKCWAIYLR